MTSKKYSKVNLTSSDLTQEKLAELKKILPDAFREEKIDWDKLRAVLDDEINLGPEKFKFTWSGKTQAIKNVLVPSTATLKPAKDEGIKFDESENLFIEGDNLEVLKLLQKAYFEQVKMIYIDPPYNTGGDFVYADDFKTPLKNYLEQTGQKDDNGNKLETNRESSGRYHSDWLSMMYPRLKLAWNLLKDDGVIFISIDDNEVHHLRMLMDEIFGEECFVAQIPWRKRTTKSDVPFGVSQDYEWIMLYSKNLDFRAGVGHDRKYYSSPDYPNDKWRLSDLTTQKVESDRPNSAFNLVDPKTKKIYPYNPKRLWGITKDTFQEYYDKGKIVFPDDYDFLKITIPAYRVFESEDKQKALKKYGNEKAIKAISTFLPKEVGMNEDGNKEMAEMFDGKIFSYPKPVSLIRYLIEIINNPDAVIMDFFAGSGTTAHAVMAQNAEDGGNRKWICVQLPEKTDSKSEAYKSGFKNIADIAKERIRRASKMIEEEVSSKRAYHNGLKEVYGYQEGEIKEVQNDEIGFRYDFDDGFKVFKLDKSNYPENNFEYDPEKSEEENKQAFEVYLSKAKQSVIFKKSNELDVVYENIIKEGLSLNSKIEQIKIAGNDFYQVRDESQERQLLICLESKIAKDAINELISQAYKEKTIILLDDALDDSNKANLALNVELKTI